MYDKHTEIVERINQVRLAKDWTYKQLEAEMKMAQCPVSLHTLQRLIRAKGRPNSRTLYKLAQFLKSLRCPPDED
jgi:transcriptional regulator with XRE-family HTH domain